MADNVLMNAGSGGDKAVTAEITWSGDTAQLQGMFPGIITGSEGAWTFTQFVGGAGAVAAGVQRITLASDDPAVVALQILDNAISGSEMQVDVVGSLPAGTNAIGKLAANSGVDIGDVDVTSIAAGDNNIGNVDIVTVPTDPFGANADAASATGSISAKLRFIASTGIPITGTVAVTQSGTWDEVGINDSGNSITVDNNGTFAVQAVCTNAGTFAVQVDGAALTALQVIDNPVLVDDAAFTPATSSVMMAGFEADEGSTDSVDEGDAGAARITLTRKLITQPQPHTTGGLSISRDIDLDNGTLTVVKNAAGQLYGWDITNTTTATVFVKFYDATSGTLGTGTPVLTIAIPGNSSDDTLSSKNLPFGIVFATGICVGAGTGVADADNTDPGANGVVANIYYL